MTEPSPAPEGGGWGRRGQGAGHVGPAVQHCITAYFGVNNAMRPRHTVCFLVDIAITLQVSSPYRGLRTVAGESLNDVFKRLGKGAESGQGLPVAAYFYRDEAMMLAPYRCWTKSGTTRNGPGTLLQVDMLQTRAGNSCFQLRFEIYLFAVKRPVPSG